jgi:hypothetical protein
LTEILYDATLFLAQSRLSQMDFKPHALGPPRLPPRLSGVLDYRITGGAKISTGLAAGMGCMLLILLGEKYSGNL